MRLLIIIFIFIQFSAIASTYKYNTMDPPESNLVLKAGDQVMIRLREEQYKYLVVEAVAHSGSNPTFTVHVNGRLFQNHFRDVDLSRRSNQSRVVFRDPPFTACRGKAKLARLVVNSGKVEIYSIFTTHENQGSTPIVSTSRNGSVSVNIQALRNDPAMFAQNFESGYVTINYEIGRQWDFPFIAAYSEERSKTLNPEVYPYNKVDNDKLMPKYVHPRAQKVCDYFGSNNPSLKKGKYISSTLDYDSVSRDVFEVKRSLFSYKIEPEKAVITSYDGTNYRNAYFKSVSCLYKVKKKKKSNNTSCR